MKIWNKKRKCKREVENYCQVSSVYWWGRDDWLDGHQGWSAVALGRSTRDTLQWWQMGWEAECAPWCLRKRKRKREEGEVERERSAFASSVFTWVESRCTFFFFYKNKRYSSDCVHAAGEISDVNCNWYRLLHPWWWSFKDVSYEL